MLMTLTRINGFLVSLTVLFTLIFLSQTDISAVADTSASQSQLTLKVTNVTFKELLLFEESLKQRIPSIENLNRQNFDAGGSRAEIKITATGDLQQFATKLALAEFAAFEVEVLNQTAEFLEIRINQRAHGGPAAIPQAEVIVRKPRVMILISERHWQAPNPATETEMIRKFTESGFRVVDPNQIRQAHASEPAGGLLHGDPAAAAAIGRQYGAELVIVGEAFSNDARVSYGLYTCRSTAEIRMLDVDTATIFIAKSQTGNGSDLTENMASQKSFQNAGELLADYLMEYIANQWNKRGPKSYEVSLVVAELTFSQLAQLEQMLQNWRGIDAINLRSFEAGVAVIGLETRHTAQRLASELVSKPLNQFSLDVTNFTTMQIDVEVRRAVALYDVQLVVSQVAFNQLVDLQQALEKWSGIDTVYLRSFDDAVAVIELHYKGGAQRLASELIRKSFDEFSLDITDFTTRRVDVEVRKESAVHKVRLIISELTFDQLEQLEQALKEWEGIDAVSLQNFDAGMAIIDLHSQHDAQHLAGELVNKSVNQFSLGVTNFTPDQINVEVREAAAVYDAQLVISGLAFDQLVQLKQVLSDWAGIDSVYLRSFDSGVAVIELKSQLDTQRLVEELVSKPLNRFSLDITNFTPNRINIEVWSGE